MSEQLNLTLDKMEWLVEKILLNLKPNMIIGLIGDLGAGKTTLVQLLAKKLGIDERVNSPTFNLQKVYNLQTPINSIEKLVHVDAYRLKSILELEDIGFFELLSDNKTLAVVEWADQLPELKNHHQFLQIKFIGIDNPISREIEISKELLK